VYSCFRSRLYIHLSSLFLV